MAPSPKSSSSTSTQLPVTDQDIKKNAQDLGWLGSILGSKDHAPIYIAGSIAVGGILIMGLVSMMPWIPDVNRVELIKSMASIVLAALTFLGGAYSGGNRR